jgi:aminoglycoside phosphotransferase (APT) family kinase protein
VRDEPDKLIASGRDGDIFDCGRGLALRKTRDGRSIDHEARIMRYVADLGYPVPVVHDVRANGSEIVMERIDGPLMADAMVKRPWTMPRYASMLADLHDELHRIPAPEWLPQWPDGGDQLIHLDLHPLNVLLSAHGPVVIDWSNAARGEALSDVALTYVLVTCGAIPGPRVLQRAAQPVQLILGRRFARRYRGEEFNEHVAVAADLKTLDPHMSDDEITNMRRLARRMRHRAGIRRS